MSTPGERPMLAAIQRPIMLGASLGGVLLDHFSVVATFVGGSALLLLASITVGSGHRLRPQPA